MLKQSVAVSAAIGLIAFSPEPAKADLADGLIGGVVGGAVGAIVTDSIRNNNKKRQQSSQPRTVVKKSAPRAASLNSQYTRSERIQIQQSLNNLGYNAGTVDGVLGKRSRAAIASYQASLGQSRTGQLTASQFASLTGVGQAQAGFGQQQNAFGMAAVPVNRPLQPNEVFLLQQSLLQMGFYNGLVDGVDSPATQAAANNFLVSQNRNPAQVTSVQRVVLAGSTAGLQMPPYLVNEANAQFAASQGGAGFAAQPQPQTTQQFGTTAVSTQPQQGTALFGAPQQQQVPQAQPVPQQPQATTGTTNLFGTAPQQQPQQQQVVPQQDQGAVGVLAGKETVPAQNVTVSTQGTGQTQNSSALFGGQTAVGFVAQPTGATQQQPATSLDIYSGTE